MEKHPIGETLRRRLLDSPASQESIAAGAGVSQSTVSRITNGRVKSTRLDVAERILGYLDKLEKKTRRGRPRGTKAGG